MALLFVCVCVCFAYSCFSSGLFFLDCYEKFVKQTKGFKLWAIKMVKLGLVDKEVLPEFDNVRFFCLCMMWRIGILDVSTNVNTPILHLENIMTICVRMVFVL